MVDIGAIVLGANSCTGLDAIRSLGEKGISVTAIDTKVDAISFYSKFVQDCFLFPSDEEKIIPSLLKLGRRKRSWVLIPTSDFFVTMVAQNWETLSKYFTLTTPPWNITQYCIDKLLTYRIAEKAGIPTPQTFCPQNKEELKKLVDQLDFKERTWILKSRSKVLFPRNRGDLFFKKKAIEIQSKKDLVELYLKNLARTGEFALIQERIPGMPDSNINVRVVMSHDLKPVVIWTDRKIRQYPLFFGAGTYRESVRAPEVAKLGLKFLNTIKFWGMAYVELKMDPRDRKFKLIEVNPRLGMGISIAKACGTDLTYILYNAALGIKYESNRKCETAVRWIYIRNDLWTIYQNRDFLPWKKTLRDIFANARKTKAFAYFSKGDLIPFFISLSRR